MLHKHALSVFFGLFDLVLLLVIVVLLLPIAIIITLSIVVVVLLIAVLTGLMRLDSFAFLLYQSTKTGLKPLPGNRLDYLHNTAASPDRPSRLGLGRRCATASTSATAGSGELPPFVPTQLQFASASALAHQGSSTAPSFTFARQT